MILTTLLSATALAVGAPDMNGALIIDSFSNAFESEAFFDAGPGVMGGAVSMRSGLEVGSSLALAVDLATGDPLAAPTRRGKERQRQFDLDGVLGGKRVARLKGRGLSETPLLVESGGGQLSFNASPDARGLLTLLYGGGGKRRQLNADLASMGEDGFFGLSLISGDLVDPVTGDTRAIPVTLDVFSNLGGPEKSVASMTRMLTGPGDYRFAFGDFADADLSDVDRVRLRIDQSAVGLGGADLIFGEFGAYGGESIDRVALGSVPAPGGSALACVSLLCACRRRRSEVETRVS